MRSKVKTKEHENLSETNIKRVIELLEAEKPVSKKVACEILNISYNTTRLTKIIEEYKNGLEEQEKRRAANRGKPATPYETQIAIESYLSGDAIAEICKQLFRSASFVKDLIEQVGVPQKVTGEGIGIIPEPCMSDTFESGQVVWHAKRNAMAIVVEQKLNVKDKSNNYYQVYIIEPIDEPSPYFPHIQGFGGYYDGAFAYDLGSLEHLKDYGVDVYRPYRQHFKQLRA